MKNRCIIRKYAAILTLSVAGIVSAFAQGVVVGYAHLTGKEVTFMQASEYLLSLSSKDSRDAWLTGKGSYPTTVHSKLIAPWQPPFAKNTSARRGMYIRNICKSYSMQ